MTAGDDWIKRNGIFVVRDVDHTHVYPYGTDSPYGSTPWFNQTEYYYTQTHIRASGVGSYDHVNWHWGVYTPRCISVQDSEARFMFIDMTGYNRYTGPGNISPNGSCNS